MASGFFALFDDIATLMDDVAVMGKVATKKTAGVLGDDLAVNADKAAGFSPSRELPVLWAISKGSLLNKLIILPVAFLLSAFASWAIVPILMLGGVYLAYEGAEKIFEWLFHKEHTDDDDAAETTDPVTAEKRKIRSAIVTDFILSIEIVIIALGTVADQPLSVQIPVVTLVAFLATVGVYGLVALIVRLDDMGYALMRLDDGDGKGFFITLGRILVASLPWVIRSLSVLGTAAMLLVAGGIFVHHIHTLHEMLAPFPTLMGELVVGLTIGSVAVVLHQLYEYATKKG
jgi:predicted DNA repair protein MutK